MRKFNTVEDLLKKKVKLNDVRKAKGKKKKQLKDVRNAQILLSRKKRFNEKDVRLLKDNKFYDIIAPKVVPKFIEKVAVLDKDIAKQFIDYDSVGTNFRNLWKKSGPNVKKIITDELNKEKIELQKRASKTNYKKQEITPELIKLLVLKGEPLRGETKRRLQVSYSLIDERNGYRSLIPEIATASTIEGAINKMIEDKEIKTYQFGGITDIVIEDLGEEEPPTRLESMNFGLVKMTDGITENGYETECAFNYLEEWGISKEYAYRSEYDDEDFDYSKGLKTSTIVELLEIKRITCVALDFKNRIFYKKIGKSHRKSAIFKHAFHHIYPVRNTNIKKSIQNKNTYNLVSDKISKVNSYVYVDENLWDVYNRLPDLQYPNSLIIEGAELLSFKTKIVDKTTYERPVRVKKRDVMWERFAKHNELDFESLADWIKNLGIKSIFNDDTKNIFTNCNKRAWVYKDDIIDLDIPIKEADINKSRYRNIAGYATNFLKFGIQHSFVKYDGVLENGFYIIKSNLIGGRDLVSYAALKFMLLRKEITEEDILEKLVGEEVVLPNIEQMCNFGTDEERRKMEKYIGCRFTGICGMQKIKVTKACVVDRDDAFRENENIRKIQIQDKEIYLTVKTNETPMFETALPIYLQVLDVEICRVKMISDYIKGKIVAYKTDAVLFQGKYTGPTGFEAGSIKVNDNASLPAMNIKQIGLQKSIVEKKGIWIDGVAGCGKTKLSKMICDFVEGKKWNDMLFPKLNYLCDYFERGKILKISPTNAAAINFGGTTIHKGLHYIKGEIKKMPKVDYLFIDELSLVSIELWEVIYYYKTLYNPMIILIGDMDQIPAVTEEHINKITIINSIIKERIHLKHNYRNKDFNRDNLFEFCVNYELKPIESNRAITKFNSTRKLHNNNVMDSLKGPHLEFKVADYKTKDEDILKYSQDTKIFVGTPIIPLYSKKNYWAKNEEFIVMDIWRGQLRIKSTMRKMFHYIDNFEGWIVNWACTNHRAQGLTWNFKYKILDWEKMSDREKYTAVTRCTSLDNIGC